MYGVRFFFLALYPANDATAAPPCFVSLPKSQVAMLLSPCDCHSNLTAIRAPFEDAGGEFIPAKSGKGVGVRLIRG
jgi:hypothetical protein